MKQAQQFERDGVKQILRIPGSWPRYTARDGDGNMHDTKDPKKATQFSGVTPPVELEGGQAVEMLEPETRRLLYLHRFAHFMQIWLPLEWFSKYCIGLGLISLAQAAAYFCLARFYDASRLYMTIISV